MLRKSLITIEKIKDISKYLSISSSFVFMAFVFFDFFNTQKLYEKPKNLIFHNITFEVRRAPKGSESRIVVYGDTGQIFSSSCYGLEKIVCEKNSFLFLEKQQLFLLLR